MTPQAAAGVTRLADGFFVCGRLWQARRFRLGAARERFLANHAGLSRSSSLGEEVGALDSDGLGCFVGYLTLTPVGQSFSSSCALTRSCPTSGVH